MNQLAILDSSADATNTGILCEKGKYRVRSDILCENGVYKGNSGILYDKGGFLTKSNIQCVVRLNIEPDLAFCVSMLSLHLLMLCCLQN